MALTYYLIDTETPEPTGDGFATVAMVDAQLINFKTWGAKTTTEKEDLIKAATQMIDDMIFWGVKLDTSQPLSFPRSFNRWNNFIFETETKFSLDNQPKILRKAIVHQLLYWLNGAAPGFPQYSVGDESFSVRQEVLCREAKEVLKAFWKE